MKIVYLSYEADMMASLGIETHIVKPKEALEPRLKTLEDQGIYIVYVSERVYQDHHRLIDQYQDEKEMTFCVMGDAGAKRMTTFTHQTLGLKTKKEESH